MDIILGLLNHLAKALESPTTLAIVILLIVVCTYVIVRLFVTSPSIRNVLNAWFKGEKKESKTVLLIKGQLDIISKGLDESLTTILEEIQEIKKTEAEHSKAIQSQLEEFNTLQRDLAQAKSEMLREIEDVKMWFKLHDQNETAMNTNVKELLQRVLDLLAHMNIHMEKIDAYVRSVVPDLKDDSKEITRGINELSKDIALIERTIQTQINSNGIQLR